VTVSTVAERPPAHELDAPNGSLVRWVAVATAAASLADRIADTDFVPEAMRDNPAMVTAAILYGDELGIGPMQALAGINIIKGKPSPSSELMRALVFRAGHSLKVLASDGQRCRIAGQRHGDRTPTEIEWNLDMARAAGLLDGNPVWRKYPRAMLLARATSELCRVMFPDVVKGLGHVADDEATAQGFDEWAGEAAGAEPEPPKTTTVARKAARKPAPAPEPDPDPPLPEIPPPAAMSADERLDEWPADVTQPPLPFDAPDGHLEPDTGGGHPTPTAGLPRPAVPPVSATTEPLPTPDDTEGVADVSGPPPQRMLAAIHKLFEDLGITKDERPLRLAITSAAVGRTVDTSLRLTRLESLTLIRVLNDMHVGILTFGVLADGTVEIFPREDERK
jgi:hypothetical protein